jgi:hypothetical protein
MAKRGRIAAAGLRPRPGVDADLQSLGMHIVGQRLHVGKLFIRVQHPVLVALRPPRCRRCSRRCSRRPSCPWPRSGRRSRANVLVRDLAGKEVPAVPSHGRRLRHHLRWGRLLRRLQWQRQVREPMRERQARAKREMRIVGPSLETISDGILCPAVFPQLPFGNCPASPRLTLTCMPAEREVQRSQFES